jgi:hypothetical protein
MRYLYVDAHRRTQAQTRTRPEQLVTTQSPRRRGRRHRRAFPRTWHAYHSPVPDSERSASCRQAFVCSADTRMTTGHLRCGRTDLGEGHPFTPLTGEHALE